VEKFGWSRRWPVDALRIDLGGYMNLHLTTFFSGICMTTFVFCGIFFLKFWKASKDKFFLFFGISCWLLSLERIILLFVEAAHHPIGDDLAESGAWVYLIRLFAFALILVAIIEKNRPQKKS
jgi:hypothetical protein